MKILIISPVPTHPTNSGNSTRILRLSEALKDQGHEVHFAHIEFQPGDRAQMGSFWGHCLHEIPYQRPWLKHRVAGIPVPDRWMHSLVRRGWADMTVDHHFDPSALPQLRELQKRFSFDAVLANYVFFSGALEAFGPGVLKVLDTHDVFSNRHQLYRKVGLVPEWFYTTPREERRGLMRADRLLAIQGQDRGFFEKLLRGARPVFELGHLLPTLEKPAAPPSSELGFIGSENVLNLDALEWFLNNVWPDLHRRVPLARLHVVGGVSHLVQDSEGVQVHGKVMDVDEAYALAPVMINPMRTGTGLKIKSLEALAHGAVLVGSPTALAGLEASIGSGSFLADTPAAWVTVLEHLMTQWHEISLAQSQALNFAQDYFNHQGRCLADGLCI